MGMPHFETLLLQRVRSNIILLTLNKPKQYNAINEQMYTEWTKALRWAAKDTETSAVCVTGKGKMYTAGGSSTLPARNLIDALIEFPKLIVAAINGPAFGIGVSTLPLFDLVYSVRDALFKTPFSELGICAEGCSSLTFRQSLGQSLAARMLYFSETITAAEMHRAGLIVELLEEKDQDFVDEVVTRMEHKLSRVSIASIIMTKSLSRSEDDIAHLKELNRRELAVVDKALEGQEFRDRVAAFLSRKSKQEAPSKL